MGMHEEQVPELPEESGFRRELTALINKHARENGSNTPDHILANFLVASLAALDTAVASREDWYGVQSTPGGSKLVVTPWEEEKTRQVPTGHSVPPDCG